MYLKFKNYYFRKLLVLECWRCYMSAFIIISIFLYRGLVLQAIVVFKLIWTMWNVPLHIKEYICFSSSFFLPFFLSASVNNIHVWNIIVMDKSPWTITVKDKIRIIVSKLRLHCKNSFGINSNYLSLYRRSPYCP